ncbi:hypothetical protein P171DRAFT_173241 [Karstenula rhodostoma CBS 690.94]|uniref:Uncharacterized protein n=1 Tax=Karstenula rhodostoma CBS 690.94 TaxID=1392251 RepID=A0A9P4U671_9PLEO|nr:hypothetical protein P171DRAFT_173241 [Karstenula rhodostoma CBS 690.94]
MSETGPSSVSLEVYPCAYRVPKAERSLPPRWLAECNDANKAPHHGCCPASLAFLRPPIYSTSPGTCASNCGHSPGWPNCKLNAGVPMRREGQRARGSARVNSIYRRRRSLAKRLPAMRPSFRTIISHFTPPPHGPARLVLLPGNTASKFVHTAFASLLQTPFHSATLLVVAAKRSRHSLSRPVSHPPPRSDSAHEGNPSAPPRSSLSFQQGDCTKLPPTISLPKQASPVFKHQ